jgi:hypothetical protein
MVGDFFGLILDEVLVFFELVLQVDNGPSHELGAALALARAGIGGREGQNRAV